MELPQSLGDEFDGFLPHDDDLGEDLQIVVGDKDNRVVINFSKPMMWLSLHPPEAIALANAIIHRAMEMSKEPTD